MTTVAFDGHYAAADGLASQGNLIVGRRTRKLFPIKANIDDKRVDILLAGAGSFQTLMMVVKHFEQQDMMNPEFMPDIEPGSFQGLIIRRDTGEVYTLEDRLIPMESEYPVALGSGADYALTAMSLGHNAEEAVQAACDLDCFSGGEIKVFDTQTWSFLESED